MVNIKKISLFFLILFAICMAFSQPAKPFSYYAEKHSESNAVVLNIKRVYTIKEGKQGLEIFMDDLRELLILGNNTAPFVEDFAHYSSLMPLLKIEAYSLIPEKKSYKKYPVNKFTEKHSDDAISFHHDYKEKVFLYPNLIQGAILISKTQHELKEPRFFGHFYFGNFPAVENAELTIICPNNVKFDYRLFGYETDRIQLTITQKGANKIYHWQMSEIPKYHRSSKHVGRDYFLPHIKLFLESYQPAKKPIEYFTPDVQYLFKWYVDISQPSKTQPDATMRALTDSLLAPLHTDIDKVKAVYYWVQDNIKYISFSEGYEGHIPRNPVEVFRWRYGDCKDMSFLIYTLLKPYGLHAAPAWIGTRDLPYKYTELPTAATDNHLINVFKDNDGSFYFLDATSKGLNINYPSAFTQGKQCLVYENDEQYSILEVPVIQPHKNPSITEFYLTFSGDTLFGKGSYASKGYLAIRALGRINGAGTKKHEVYEGLFSVGSNKFKLESVNPLEMSRDSGFRVNYSFRIPNYITSTKDEVYINLNLEKELANAQWESKFVIPLEFDYLIEESYNTIFKIPENYKLEYLPENLVIDNEIFSVGFIYEQKDRYIYFNKYLILKKLTVPTELFQLYNETVDKVCRMYKQSIVLRKSKL